MHMFLSWDWVWGGAAWVGRAWSGGPLWKGVGLAWSGGQASASLGLETCAVRVKVHDAYSWLFHTMHKSIFVRKIPLATFDVHKKEKFYVACVQCETGFGIPSLQPCPTLKLLVHTNIQGQKTAAIQPFFRNPNHRREITEKMTEKEVSQEISL